MEYIVRTTDKPGREELKWALRFTVLERDGFACRECGTMEQPLDVSHILSRNERPDLEFDPDNVQVLCRACHMAHDHEHDHRPSGRPLGFKLSEESKRKIGESGRATKSDAEWRRQHAERVSRDWDKRGRKPLRVCSYCLTTLSRRKTTEERKFCSYACFTSARQGLTREKFEAEYPIRYA